jgi:hypothetical protein
MLHTPPLSKRCICSTLLIQAQLSDYDRIWLSNRRAKVAYMTGAVAYLCRTLLLGILTFEIWNTNSDRLRFRQLHGWHPIRITHQCKLPLPEACPRGTFRWTPVLSNLALSLCKWCIMGCFHNSLLFLRLFLRGPF